MRDYLFRKRIWLIAAIIVLSAFVVPSQFQKGGIDSDILFLYSHRKSHSSLYLFFTDAGIGSRGKDHSSTLCVVCQLFYHDNNYQKDT